VVVVLLQVLLRLVLLEVSVFEVIVCRGLGHPSLLDALPSHPSLLHSPQNSFEKTLKLELKGAFRVA
jgi:hypothetical protein